MERRGVEVQGEPRVAEFERLTDIVENGYCMGCGLCTQVVEPGAIEMGFTGNGQIRPRARRALEPGEEARICRVCPGVSVTGPFDGTLERPDAVWGDLRRVVSGHAADAALRFRASTGGVMTAINRYLLESARVAFVLQVEPGGADALSSDPVLVREPERLLDGAQSRYGASAPLAAIREALALGERFAVSLKPCDIAGVRNLQREDPRARELIAFAQTMFCGTVPSRESSFDFFRRRGVDPLREPPSAFQWRGNGCPGPTVGQTADGQVLEGTYNELWNDNPWTTQYRCKICPDAIGLQADIATGDTWPGGAPVGESEGTNAIIAHTAIGLEVLEACEREGRLVLRAAEPLWLDSVQPHHVRLRRSFAARVAGASLGGLPTPRFEALAAEACAAGLSETELADAFDGSLKRVRAGQGDEADTCDDWVAVGAPQ